MARLDISSVTTMGREERIDTNFIELYTTVFAASANYSATVSAGALVSGGAITGASASFTATCAAVTLAASGAVTGASASFTATCAAVTLAASGVVTGASASFTATCAAAALTASGAISAATISGSVVAVQSGMEAGSSITTVVSPGVQHFHPGHVKLHFRCDMAGNFVGTSGVDYYNMTSLTDTGTGIVDCTIATDFATANYNVNVGTVNSGLANFVNYLDTGSGFTAGTFRMRGVNSATAGAVDTAYYSAAGFGDFA